MSNLIQALKTTPHQPNLLDVDEGNPIEDGAIALAQILQDHFHALGIKEVFADDPMAPSVFPSVAIEYVNDLEPIYKTLGENCRILLQMNYNIWYYRAIVSTGLENSLVRRKVWDIKQIFIEHRTINGFCQSEISRITGSSITPRVRQENTMDAGVVNILVPHAVCIARNTSRGG